jgi:hypothetical protein
MKPIVMYTPSFFSITFIEEGRPILVMAEDDRYAKCVDLYKKEDYSALKKLLCIDIIVNDSTYDDIKIDIEYGRVTYKGTPVHNVVVNKVFELIEGKLPYKHLVAFLKNILECDSFTVLNELYLFLESNETMPIMDDGSFVAYRVVDCDYLSKHKNPDGSRNRNEIGDIVEQQRNLVNPDREQTCAQGLHFCSYSYIPSYGRSCDDRVMIVKVFPQDVIAIPNDYNNSKGRCCKYEVIGEVENYEGNTEDFRERAEKTINDVAYSDSQDDDLDIVESYLSELNEPYRSQALANIDVHYMESCDTEIDSLEEALEWAFDWGETEEGFDYWSNLFDIIHHECNACEDEEDEELSDSMKMVKNIIKNQLDVCGGQTTVRKVSKSTKPYLCCKIIVDMAEELGFTVALNDQALSKSVIQ